MFYGVRLFKKVWVILQHQVRFLNIAPYIIFHQRYFAKVAMFIFNQISSIKTASNIKSHTCLEMLYIGENI